MSSFIEKLEARIQQTNSLLCVGLDPHENELSLDNNNNNNMILTEQMKCDAAYTFCKNLIDNTAEYTICYKPNIAFFEALGSTGIQTLQRICTECIIQPYNNTIPILLDCKRGDIGSTATAYATACYHPTIYNADAVTLSPLMGYDSIEPFLSSSTTSNDDGSVVGKGIFLLCKTSNPGSNDFLSLNVCNNGNDTTTNTTETLYERIASMTANVWYPKHHTSTTFGLVVGATDIEAIQKVRSIINEKNIWILAPGIGSQGGNLQQVCQYGMNQYGSGLIIPISRGISKAINPKQAAYEYYSTIQQYRNERLQNKSSTATTTTTTEAAVESAGTVLPSTGTTIICSSNTVSTIQSYQKEFIQFCIQQQVLKFGNYTLKSGRISPYFFNAGLFYTGYALYEMSCAYTNTIMSSLHLSDGKDNVKFDVIFGPAYKGISLGATVCSALYQQHGINVDFAYNRKEVKDHGEGGQLVGASMDGKRVLIIDDVITAGTAIRESYDILKSVNAIPIGVVIALDRAEIRSLEDKISAVQAVERDFSIPVVSIITLVELQHFLEQSNDYEAATLQSVIDYRKEYGAV